MYSKKSYFIIVDGICNFGLYRTLSGTVYILDLIIFKLYLFRPNFSLKAVEKSNSVFVLSLSKFEVKNIISI